MSNEQRLIEIATSYIGTKEVGDNGGPQVEEFQKSVGGVAAHQSWCLAFQFFCIKKVDAEINEKAMMSVQGHSLFETEHCMTLWHNSKATNELKEPVPGSLVIWQFEGGSSGHVGLVVEVDGDKITTIEGNTSDGSGIEREGDGCYKRSRHKWVKTGKMITLGYLRVW
jgi:hypothetical protein